MTIGPFDRCPLTQVATAALLLAAALAFPTASRGAANEEPSSAVAENPAGESAAAGPSARRVSLVRLRLPITGNDDAVYQARLQRAVDRLIALPDEADEPRRPLLVLELTPDPDGGATEFERALRLARFLVSESMTRVKTLAYLPDSIDGHAALIALACEEIAMAPDATLGSAGVTEDAALPIEPGIRASYEQIAEARRTAPPAVVLAMIDREAELLRIESDRGVEFVLGSELEARREDRAIVSEESLAPSGTFASLTGREARAQGVAKYLAADRDTLARALAVPGAALLEDQSLAGEWRPVMVDLSGPITNRAVRRIETLIGDELERNQVNWVGVRIDSTGGDVPAALRLSQTLAELGDGEVRTVAYVPKRVDGPATLVALACDQLVMQDGSTLQGVEPREAAADENEDQEDAEEDAEAEDAEDDDDPLGDDAGRRLGELRRLLSDPEAELEAARSTIRETLAPATTRGWSLLAAVIDPGLELARYANRQTGAEQVFCPEELEEQAVEADWRRVEPLKPAGETLEFEAARAEELGIAWHTVEQFDDLQALYGLPEAPRTAVPNWALELIEALASPGLAALLLVVGVIGLYIELNTPGLGLGGFVASVAFLLFFWSKFLDGTADWLEVLLFVTGVVFVLIELVVLPGFGVFGLGGALMIVGSLVLASQTFILPQTETQLVELRNSLATVAGAGLGFLLLAAVLRQYLPHSPLFRWAMLSPGEEADRIEQDRREQMADYDHLVGKTGVATTDLLPAGRAEIDGEPVDVLCRSGSIDRGEAVEVVEAHAQRVIVRKVRG